MVRSPRWPQDANWATVSILTDSGPDEVAAVAASYDDTGRYEAQTPFSDQLAAHWEGALWSVDATHNSMITIGNGGRKATRAQLTFRYQTASGPETYVLEQKLDKDEQMFVDLSDLVRNQTPDVNGHTFSQTATSGSYTLLELGSPGLGNLFEGKVVTDKRFGDVAYGCMICCGMNDVGLSPNPITLGVGSTTSYTGTARNGCTHALQSINGYYSTWWSDNTAVATAAAGQGTAIGPGTTTVWASGILPFPSVTEDSPDGCETQDMEDPAEMNAAAFTGVLTADDNFSGRNTTNFGIAELINLSFSSNPAGTTAASLGGLRWTIVSGGGTLSNAGTEGTAQYTAPPSPSTVVLRLADGQGNGSNITITVIAPSGAHLTLSSNIRHTIGFLSVGFKGSVFLEPSNVSFANLQFAEGTVAAVASGYFASLNGVLHPPTAIPISVGSCSSTTGCLAGVDTVDTTDDPPPFSAGDFLWAIPWRYRVGGGGVFTTFATANQHLTAAANGTASAEKAGAGPFSKNASDPTSTFYVFDNLERKVIRERGLRTLYEINCDIMRSFSIAYQGPAFGSFDVQHRILS